MKAVILAGGAGTRLAEETDRIPKPMVEIGGRPILWHIMRIFSHHGVDEFVICLGYRGYLIKEYFINYHLHLSDVTIDVSRGSVSVLQSFGERWKVTLVDTGANSMTGGRIRRVAKYVSDAPFYMTYGDGLSDVDLTALARFHSDRGRLATVTAVNPPGRFGLLKLSGEEVSGFAEKADAKESWINGGFFVLDPRVIEYIDGDESIWEREPVERLAAEGQLAAYRHSGFWQAMDTLRDKQLLESYWNSGSPPWKVWP